MVEWGPRQPCYSSLESTSWLCCSWQAFLLFRKARKMGTGNGLRDIRTCEQWVLYFVCAIIDINDAPQIFSIIFGDTFLWPLSIIYLIFLMRLLFKFLAHDGSFHHCSLLYLAVPGCTIPGICCQYRQSICGDKSVLWRFLYLTNVKKSDMSPHVEKFLNNVW